MIISGTFLVDGFVAGIWKIERGSKQAGLVVSSFAPLRRQDRAGLAEEGERLLAFAASGTAERAIRFEVAPPRSTWMR